jgi:hypothetical protein
MAYVVCFRKFNADREFITTLLYYATWDRYFLYLLGNLAGGGVHDRGSAIPRSGLENFGEPFLGLLF